VKDGEHIEYFKTGEIYYKCNYLDGKLHGEYISYYLNGEISYVWYYIYSEWVTELEWISYIRNIKLEFLGL